MERRLVDAHVLEALGQVPPRQFVVEALDQRDAFLARDLSVADFLSSVVAGAPETEES